MSSDQAGMDLLSRGPVDLLGEAIHEEDWREIFEMMREPMEEDLLSPIAAAMPAPVPVTAGRPPKGAKRMTAYGYPTWREIAPEPYAPRPTRTRGKGLGVPEAARKRTCIDLSVQLVDEEDVVQAPSARGARKLPLHYCVCDLTDETKEYPTYIVY